VKGKLVLLEENGTVSIENKTVWINTWIETCNHIHKRPIVLLPIGKFLLEDHWNHYLCPQAKMGSWDGYHKGDTLVNFLLQIPMAMPR